MQMQRWISIPAVFLLVATTEPTGFAAGKPGAGEELFGNYNFVLEVGGAAAGHFRSVSGLSAETEVVEFREGGENSMVHKLPGRLKYSNIVLKRGFVPDTVLRDWIWTNLDPEGTVDRRDGALVLRDRAGNEAVRYEFFDAWPCKWSGFTPEEHSDAAFVEEIVICIEFFREVLPVVD
ncbi:MAG TPA: phage tail protein [Xanthomonadales bacterium]|nr:phage tail protein [Xanthomonadales bacterium]